MAGKKGRSGPPPGNLNAAKSVLPALTRLRQGKPLPPGMGRVLALANRETEELVTDKGGWGNMSGAERLMLSNWKSARKAELLIWRELLERGAELGEGGRLLGPAAWSPAPGPVSVGPAGRPAGTGFDENGKAGGSARILCHQG